MGREHFYKPGSFYRIDDRTGFCIRAERQQMEWTGLIIDKRVWERRHPQDFVKGVFDNQTVPYARPRQPNPPLGETTGALFQVYGDLPAEVTFEKQDGKMMVYHAASVVTAAGYPKGF
jgi:hypothetical protein